MNLYDYVDKLFSVQDPGWISKCRPIHKYNWDCSWHLTSGKVDRENTTSLLINWLWST